MVTMISAIPLILSFSLPPLDPVFYPLNPRAPTFFIYFCSARLLLMHTAQFVTC